MAHRHILTAYTGWTIPPCEGKDDHLDILLDTLAGMRRHCMRFTRSTGRHLVYVYAPADGGRPL
jgi:hypothetical protein